MLNIFRKSTRLNLRANIYIPVLPSEGWEASVSVGGEAGQQAAREQRIR